MSDTTITPFDWKHVEQHHYECHWHGFRLVANQDIWKIEWNGFTRQGTPRTVSGVRISAARRAEVARANAEAAAYRQFMKEGRAMLEHRIVYEEVPGSRTTQQAIDQPQRERVAYEELRPGDVIQPGDEWQNGDGRWHPLVLMAGACTQVRDSLRARRPHSITALEKYRGDLIDDIQHAMGQRDEARMERDRLQGLIDDLLDEPTAKQVQDMLRTWATELDWSAGCFDSVAREQIDTIQKTLVAVIERIETMINPEGGIDDN